MANQAAKFDLSTSFLDIPKTLAYGIVRGAGNKVLQQENADKSRVAYFMLGEGPWDSMLRLWINSKQITLPNTAIAHFHPGTDGIIGAGIGATSTGGDQGVDQFFALIPPGLDPVTFSRYAWLALNVQADPGAPSPDLTVLADYQAMRVRQFDSSGNQTAFAWTQNPAWWICDFLIRKFVLREAKVNQPLAAAELARFDWASFAAAAAYYDTVIGLVASDNFNRANGGPGGNWTAQTGGFTIASNAISCSAVAASTRAMMYWNAISFANDQFSQITVTTKSASSLRALGVAVRCSTSAETYYAFYNDSTTAYLFKVVAGTTTVISSVARAPANGDVLRLEISGTALTAKINGTTLLTGTDSSIASGGPGITAFGVATTDPFADDWSGGNIAGGAGVPRFSDGGVVYVNDSQTADHALEQMLLMCRSYLLERNGKLSLYADQPRSSVFTFNSGNVGARSFKAYKTNLRGAKNRLTATFRDSTIASGSTDDATRFAISTVKIDHEAHQRAVGARGAGLAVIPKVTELALDLGVNTPERVWRILDAILVRQLGDDADANAVYNAPFSATWEGYEDSLRVEPGDAVTIDPSISEEHGGKLFEALEVVENPDGTRALTALEYMPNAFPDVAPTQQTLQAPAPGTGISVPAGGANFSYRPLSNPLTAADNGTVPVATVAAFTMRVAGTDIAIAAGSVSATSGDYGKTAFIYYDDPSLLGGNVVFNMTFVRETAISGFARFFVGSIIIPASGGGSTVGFNDGGTGAQYAKTFRLLPTSQTLTGAWTSAANAIDNDLSTFAVASSTTANVVMVANVFPSFTGLFSANTLAVLSQVTAISIGPVLIEYSLDGGTTWLQLRSTTTVDSAPVLSTMSVPLRIPTNLVQVRITLPGGTGSPTTVTGNSGTAADDAAIGTVVWSNPTNAQGNQTTVSASVSTIAPNTALTTHYLKLTNFGFTLPAGATINGIQAVVTLKSNFFDDGLGNDRYVFDNSVRLYKAGVLVGTNHAIGSNWPSTQSTESFGGSTDLWGTTWALADINNAGFGIGISAIVQTDGTGGNATGQIYRVALTVFYTTSSGSASATTRIYDISQQVTL